VVPALWRAFPALLTFGSLVAAQSYSAPAGVRPPLRHAGASILPGGRVIAPFGEEYVTGAGAFGLAVSASGRAATTSNSGPGRNSLTVLDRGKNGWEVRQLLARSPDALDQFEAADWRGVFMGIAFANDHAVYASEGNTGRVSFFDWNSDRRRIIDLNQGGFADSYTGDLVFDAERGVVYVVDQANFRVAMIDARTRQITASVRVGRLPFAMALSPDRRKLYVTNAGMFQYQAIPGADPQHAGATGLEFPPFGFPSAEATAGIQRQTARGAVQVPGLGDPNAREANSLCVVDVSNPAAPKVEAFIPTGVPLGEKSHGGSSPSGVVAQAERVYVSNAGNDSITVIDAQTNRVETEIPIRIPGLEQWRGILPIGMAFHEKSGRLLVAEAGINAVGVIDTRQNRVVGHIPAAWFPTRVAIWQDTVFVANARGHGRGPNAPGGPAGWLLPAQQLQGSLSVFPLPAAEDLAPPTATVMEANGFNPRGAPPPRLPAGIRHVVLIVKSGRAFDEMLGDIPAAANGAVMGAPEIARFGSRGYVDGRGKRFSFKDVNVTPNHHAIARQWAFSDNFYADSDVSAGGHHWLAGVYPNAWTASSFMAAASDQNKDFRMGAAPGRLLFAGASVVPEDQPEGGTIWDHLARHGISFYNFGEGLELPGAAEGRFPTNVPMPQPLFRNTSRQYPGFNTNIPDQHRASQFIREMDERYGKGAGELPRFLFLYLPNDAMAPARPDSGYPYEESFLEDNDYALGRILEYLSQTRWWNQMAVFVTENSAQGGIDHLDAHRTVLLAAGPWVRKHYVSHANTGFPGLLKTIFRLLGVPPLNLFDACATDLSDLFAARADPAGYKAIRTDARIFDPAAVQKPR
jgi:YVTN family beta-propeller protein